MAAVNSTPSQGIELSDVIDTYDKITLHASFLKTHLGVIQDSLEGDPEDYKVGDALQLAYAANYFLEFIEKASEDLLELARQKETEATR